MPSDRLYLRPDVQVEPLVDQWYAWSYLIPPATLARNMTHRHFRIMDSYLSAPDVHASACRNPRMLGGPFMDYSARRVEEVRELRERTARLRAPLVEFSAALERLDHILRTVPNGHGLNALYAQVPEPLRGYVELAYDIRHNAMFRLLEPLLYRSRYYDRSAQSLLMSVTSGDDRPFVLSTPRLESEGTVQLRWSFDDPRVDRLFRFKREPASWDEIVEPLHLDVEDARRLRTFFTSEPPPSYRPYTGDGVRWRYFGHACVLIETKHLNILFDPVLSYTYESSISRYTYADLPDHIDLVLITHNHMDHILIETLLQIRHKVRRIVVPRGGTGAIQEPSLRLMFENIGFTNVEELGDFQSFEIPGGSVTGLPFVGEHGDLLVAAKLAYLVQLGDERLAFAADLCNVEPRIYEHVYESIGDIGTMFIGMECDGAPMSWLYGPLLLHPIERSMDHSRRLAGSNFEQARSLVDRFRCHDVYVYAMGQEPWLNHVMSIKYTDQSRPIVESNRLLDYCQARGVVAERLFGEKEILIDRVYPAACPA